MSIKHCNSEHGWESNPQEITASFEFRHTCNKHARWIGQRKAGKLQVSFYNHWRHQTSRNRKFFQFFWSVFFNFLFTDHLTNWIISISHKTDVFKRTTVVWVSVPYNSGNQYHLLLLVVPRILCRFNGSQSRKMGPHCKNFCSF